MRGTELQTHCHPGPASLSACCLQGPGRAHAGAQPQRVRRVSAGEHFSYLPHSAIRPTATWPALSMRVRGDSTVPRLGSLSELLAKQQLPLQLAQAATAGPAAGERARQGCCSLHTWLHISTGASRQRPANTAANSHRKPQQGAGEGQGLLPEPWVRLQLKERQLSGSSLYTCFLIPTGTQQRE